MLVVFAAAAVDVVAAAAAVVAAAAADAAFVCGLLTQPTQAKVVDPESQIFQHTVRLL